jgi:hypothetical protein
MGPPRTVKLSSVNPLSAYKSTILRSDSTVVGKSWVHGSDPSLLYTMRKGSLAAAREADAAAQPISTALQTRDCFMMFLDPSC